MPIKNKPQGEESDVTAALAYPFDIPTDPFLLTMTGCAPLDRDSGALVRESRIPILACGSNQSPGRLAHKLGPLLAGNPIPVSKGRLLGFDVVYSAHFSSYGSVPATLAPSREIEACVSVTWLTPLQLHRMHLTEALGVNYGYGLLEGIDLQLNDGYRLSQVYAYISLRGLLVLDGGSVSMAEIKAQGNRAKAMRQTEVQQHLYDYFNPPMDLRAFVLGNIHDQALRADRNRVLQAQSRPFESPRYRPLEG